MASCFSGFSPAFPPAHWLPLHLDNRLGIACSQTLPSNSLPSRLLACSVSCLPLIRRLTDLPSVAVSLPPETHCRSHNQTRAPKLTPCYCKLYIHKHTKKKKKGKSCSCLHIVSHIWVHAAFRPPGLNTWCKRWA